MSKAQEAVAAADAAQDIPLTIREQVRSQTAEEMIKANTGSVLLDMISVLSITFEGKQTKAQLVDLIRAKFPAPDPALRGKSTAPSPVALVWEIAHNAWAAATKEAPVRRKDVVAACREAGIAYYTARTQYQAYYKFTDKGAAPITVKTEGLPKGLGGLLGYPQPEAEVVAEA